MPTHRNETLVNISELLLKFRGEEKPNIATVARVPNNASGLLWLKDPAEKMEAENAARIQIAKNYGLTRTNDSAKGRGRSRGGCGPKSMKTPNGCGRAEACLSAANA
jgi:hypothetical protein